MRQAEMMRSYRDAPGRGSGEQQVPGLVVVIQGPGGSVQQIPPAPPPLAIEAEALPERKHERLLEAISVR